MKDTWQQLPQQQAQARCGCGSAVCSCSVVALDTDCITTTVTGVGTADSPYTISSVPVISPTAGNQLVCSANGLFVPAAAPAISGITTEDTFCIDLSGNGTGGSPLSAVPIIDPDPDNQLSCGPLGLFVPSVSGTGGGGEVDVFVAAFDTPAARQAEADYVCDGVADQVEIQAALDLLGTAGGIGGRVFLMEGNFNTTATITIPFNVSLYGLGRGNGATTLNHTGVSYAITSTTNGVTIANFFLLGIGGGGIQLNGSFQYRVSDLDVVITDSTLPGIYLLLCENGIVENNYVDVDDSDGIVLFNNLGADGSIITSNRVENGGIALVTAVESHVIGNTVRATSTPNTVLDPTLVGSAIIVDGGSDNMIIANIITGAARHGIDLLNSDLNSIVTNKVMNVGFGGTFDGIFLEDSDQNTVLDNRVSAGGVARYGINISDAASDDNLVTNNDLFLGYVTAAVNDAGTATVLTAGNRP